MVQKRKINLLTQQGQHHQQQKRYFIQMLIVSVLFAIVVLVVTWWQLNRQVEQQQRLNHLIQVENRQLAQQLATAKQLNDQREYVAQLGRLTHYLQGERPIVVRLLDEIVRIKPEALYFTKIQRIGNQFVFYGQAKDAEVVAQLMKALEQSVWFRHVVLTSFEVSKSSSDNTQPSQPSSLKPHTETDYGTFLLKAEVEEFAMSDDVNGDVLE